MGKRGFANRKGHQRGLGVAELGILPIGALAEHHVRATRTRLRNGGIAVKGWLRPRAAASCCLGLIALGASHSQAQQGGPLALTKDAVTPGNVTLPSWKPLPRTANSVPLGTVVLDGGLSLKKAPTLNAVPLTRRGFVEEEFLVTGTANLYAGDDAPASLKAHGFGASPEGAKTSVAYTTRILVRLPKVAKDFYGTVYLEPLHDETEDDPIWRAAWPKFLEHGDVWVGMTVSKASADSLRNKFDKTRYHDLDIEDERLRWDIQTQVAALMRSPSGPLGKTGLIKRADDFEGRLKIYATGWSLSGCMQTEYLNKGFHALARRSDAPRFSDVRPNGRPLIDGYFSGACPEAGTAKSVDEAVAVVQIMTETDYQAVAAATAALRRKDGNVAGQDWYRWYDIAGTGEKLYIDLPQFSIQRYQMSRTKSQSSALDCAQPISRLPGWADSLRSIFTQVDFWVRTSRPAPSGQIFELNSDGSIKRDALGNASGGVRTHWVDVPVSTFVASSGDGACARFAHEIPLPQAELEKRYKSRQDYLIKVEDKVFALANQGYLDHEDAAVQRDAAMKVKLSLAAGEPITTGISGSWTVLGNISGIAFAPRCKLRQGDNKLEGTCVMEGFESALTGTVADERVNWAWEFKSGITMQFDGTLMTPKTIKGVVKVPGAEGQWSATRLD
jgi:hypothetical protein